MVEKMVVDASVEITFVIQHAYALRAASIASVVASAGFTHSS
jgi:hypothetical protein